MQRTHAEGLRVEYLVPAEGGAEQAVDFGCAGAARRRAEDVDARVRAGDGRIVVIRLRLPSGRTEYMPGSVPLGIQENDTRSSITKKKGASATGFTLDFTGRSASAALAKPKVASVENNSAASATIARLENCIVAPPKHLHVLVVERKS
jgi:hypothetical protein